MINRMGLVLRVLRLVGWTEACWFFFLVFFVAFYWSESHGFRDFRDLGKIFLFTDF